MSLQDSYCKSLVIHAFQILQPRPNKYLEQNSIQFQYSQYTSQFVSRVFFLRNGHNVHTRHGFARWLRRSIRYPLDASRKELLRFTALGNSSGSLYLRMAAALCFFEEQKATDTWGRSVDSVGWIFIGRQEIHDMEVTQKKDERRFQQIISKLDSSWSFQRFFIVFPELLGR